MGRSIHTLFMDTMIIKNGTGESYACVTNATANQAKNMPIKRSANYPRYT